MSPKFCRRASGLLFLLADIILLAGNLEEANAYQLAAAILFITCAIAMTLSANNHRWLFYNASAVIIAYMLVSFTGSGQGTALQYIGGMIGIIGGLLIFRAALQRETGKQYTIPYPLNLADRYPLATAGSIEGACAFFIAAGSLINADMLLFTVATLWTLAHIFLFASDEYLRQRVKPGQTL